MLIYGGKTLVDDNDLSHYGILDESTIHMVVSHWDSSQRQIEIKSQHDGVITSLDLGGIETVDKLKSMIED